MSLAFVDACGWCGFVCRGGKADKELGKVEWFIIKGVAIR